MATAEEYASWIVQNADKRGTPEFDTVAQAYQMAKEQKSTDVMKAPITQIRTAPQTNQQPATLMDRVQTSAPMRVLQGMRDPIDAGAQFLSHIMPSGVTAALDYLPNKLRQSDSPLAQTLGYTAFGSGAPEAVDAGILQNQQNYERSRSATGQQGIDLARLTGNVVSPANAALASALPIRVGRVASTALQGGGIGAVGGLMTPVDTEQGQQSYGATKATQVGLGAATGAVLTPIMLKFGEAVVRRLPQDAEVRGVRASLETDSAMAAALKDIGARMEDIPKAQYDALRAQVLDAMKNGKKLDAAALFRKADFEAAGLQSTTGQITRDATQFARERNLRGVSGVGESLMARLEGQNQALTEKIGGFATGATDPAMAGGQLARALQGIDQGMKRPIDTAYLAARDHLGRASPMDAYAFSKAANLALDEGMLGHYLPVEARNILNDVSSGKIPFNVNTAVQIDSTLSAAQRTAGYRTVQALAIGKVRDALNSTGIGDNVGESAKAAFDAARGLAKQRFSTIDANPALDAVVNQGAGSEKVLQVAMTGDAATSWRLASILSKQNPEAFNQVKAQIGQKLEAAAFGPNAAGDQIMSPQRYAKALSDFGKTRLQAWFSPNEIDQMNRLSRVGAYINSTPSAAPVNYSNTAGALASILGKIPGVGMLGNVATIGKSVAQPVINQRVLSTAMASKVPQGVADLTPEQLKALMYALSLGSVGTGEYVAGGVR